MTEEKPKRRGRAVKTTAAAPPEPKKRKSFHKIKIEKPHKAIYSPASLLLNYAREHENAGFRYVSEEEINLREGEIFYKYDHLEVEPIDKKTDSITLYLTKLEKTEDEVKK